jgi:hypothetical protein
VGRPAIQWIPRNLPGTLDEVGWPEPELKGYAFERRRDALHSYRSAALHECCKLTGARLQMPAGLLDLPAIGTFVSIHTKMMKPASKRISARVRAIELFLAVEHPHRSQSLALDEPKERIPVVQGCRRTILRHRQIKERRSLDVCSSKLGTV